MPELPEVEVICRGLRQALVGQTISSVDVLVARSFPAYNEQAVGLLPGCRVTGVKRRGKLAILELKDPSGQDWCLLVHLRMTGQLIYRANLAASSGPAEGPADAPADAPEQPSAGGFAGGYPSQSLVGELPDKSTRVVIGFEDQSRLFFNDQRKFGYFKLILASGLEHEEFVSKLGPEPLDPGFDWRLLRSRLQPAGRQKPGQGQRASEASIKAKLLDQQVIAGVGNIYADESLFAARLDPRRPASSLTVPELKRLAEALCERLQRSIDDGGSTARNYVDALGLRGEFLDLHAQVYGRGGQSCPRCGQTLQKTRVAGRGTVYCPKCQH